MHTGRAISALIGALSTGVIAFCGTATADDQIVAPDAYTLPVGTRLEYETSVSLGMSEGRSQEARIKSTYTVLRQSGTMLTLFAATDVLQAVQDGMPVKDDSPGARFTFEMGLDGDIQPQTMGIDQLSFPGWAPRLDFQVIPKGKETTITVPLPLVNQPVLIAATRDNKGDDVVVKTSYDGRSADSGAMGISVKKCAGTFVYSPKDKSLLSSRCEWVLGVAAPGGRKQEFQFMFESTRKQQSHLSDKETADIQKDVAAGLAVFDTLRGTQASGPDSTSATVAALTKYIEDYPSGQFAQAFKMISKQVETMKQMELNAARIVVGKPAPAFEAKSIDGKTIKLADFTGKVVLLDFWATWCGPCRAEFPNIKDMYDKFKNKGFEIIGVSGDHSEEPLRKFIKEKSADWPQILQTDPGPDSVMVLYGITKFPTTVLVGKDGVIKEVDLRGEELSKAVEDLLGGAAARDSGEKDATGTSEPLKSGKE